MLTAIVTRHDIVIGQISINAKRADGRNIMMAIDEKTMIERKIVSFHRTGRTYD
jgi:hypothetical protein